MHKLKRMLLAALACIPMLASAEDDRFAKMKIERQELAPGIFILTGAGGNIGVSAGEDGILIIDAQYAQLAKRIEAAFSDLSPKPLKYVVNTHVHGDHVGGNEYFGKHATIFAHHEVLTRLSEDEKVPKQALPVITYGEGIRFHFNGMTLDVQHFPTGHTDGDSVVWFREQNVLHMGDLLFNGKFPYIDLNRGGTVEGYIKNVKRLYAQINEDTQIIAGHGPVADRGDLALFIAMLDNSVKWMTSQKSAGKDLEALKAAGVPKQLEGWGWRFITDEFWIETLYNGLP